MQQSNGVNQSYEKKYIENMYRVSHGELLELLFPLHYLSTISERWYS